MKTLTRLGTTTLLLFVIFSVQPTWADPVDKGFSTLISTIVKVCENMEEMNDACAIISGETMRTSHIFMQVSDMDATIAFYCDALGGELQTDVEFSHPALDAIYGKEDVLIRSTFIGIGGIRLHPIERLDIEVEPTAPSAFGIGGISFNVPDLDEARQQFVDAGLSPTPDYDFAILRMFFLEDPDGISIEFIEGSGY